jgi:hypothetical protein
VELCNLGKFSAPFSRWQCFPGETSQSVMHFQLACLPHMSISVVFYAASSVKDAGCSVANVSCLKCYALFARMEQKQCLMRRSRLDHWCVWCSALLSVLFRKIWIWGCIPQFLDGLYFDLCRFSITEICTYSSNRTSAWNLIVCKNGKWSRPWVGRRL